MSRNGLYHKDIGLPVEAKSFPRTRVTLEWGNHADHARTSDRYAPEIPRFESIPLQCFEIVECEVRYGLVTKYVVRGHWTADYDVVFVLIPDATPLSTWFVKTVWINERNDTHKTLDRSKYVC